LEEKDLILEKKKEDMKVISSIATRGGDKAFVFLLRESSISSI